MGWTFSNVSILKGSIKETDLRKYVVQHMKKRGYTPIEGALDAGKTVRIVNNPSSSWITIHDDEPDGTQQDKLAVSLSKKFHTHVLSLMNVDSDFMQIDLYLLTKTDTAIVGTPYDIVDPSSTIPRGDPKAWQAIAKDPEALIAQFAKDYVFSEEVLLALQEHIGICRDDILLDPSDEAPTSSGDLLLYFAAKDSGEPYIADGATVLDVFSNFEPKINSEYRTSFNNKGGVSTGLGIWILGPSVEKKAFSIDEVEVRRYEDPRDENAGVDSLRTMTAKTRMMNTSYGENSIYAAFPDFVIPEGMNPSAFSKSIKYMKSYYQHFFDVIFVPKGPEDTDVSDLFIIGQPLTNKDGCAKSHLWKDVIAEMKEYEREHGYI